VVTKYASRKKLRPKRCYRYDHLGTNQEIRPFANDINTLERAVKERLLFVSDGNGGFKAPPQPEDEAFTKGCKWIIDAFENARKVVAPLTKDTFLRAYGGHKRRVYENAFKSLEKVSLNSKDYVAKVFVKFEKTNFTRKKDPVPRAINPRNPRYHVSIALYLKRIEKEVFKRLDLLWSSPSNGVKTTVMKGLNAVQRAKVINDKWKKFVNPVAIGVDASRFDQHVSIDALKFEHAVYKTFFRGTNLEKFSKLLKHQLVNKLSGRTQDGRLRCTIPGKRMSGDVNTALGNTLLMCSMMLSLRNKLGINFEFINDGDDGVIICEQRHCDSILSKIHKHCLSFGFNMVCEVPVADIEKIEFCQSKPVAIDVDNYIMVRDIKTSFDKDCTSMLPLTTEKFARKWMRSVGECGLKLTSGIPVLQKYYNIYIQQSTVAHERDYSWSGMKLLAENMEDKGYQEPTWYARYSYWKAFGVAPAVQHIQEEIFSKEEVDHKLSKMIRKLPNPVLRIGT
jgi:hypothetical protein